MEHLHLLFANGGWSADADDAVQFRSTSPPTLGDVSTVVAAVAADLARLVPAGPADEQEPDDAQQVLERASWMNRSAFGPSWSSGASRKRGERRPRRHGPRLRYPPLEVYLVSPASFAVGVEERVIDGVRVWLTTPAKSVADMFKFRRRVGFEAALDALKQALRERAATPGQIDAMAKVCRVQAIVRPYLEALA